MTAFLGGQTALFLSEAAVLINLGSIALAALRIGRRRTPVPLGNVAVSVVVPCRGRETFSAATLDAAFALDHAPYELIFCVAHDGDPIVPLIRRKMETCPHISARILVGDDRISDNPKLNNCVKGWHAARHRWIVLADSNVLMPPDYLRQMLSAWQTDTGLVCSPPLGSKPSGFAALVECAFLNSLQARWQYAAEAAGLGFAQGKSMLWRRSMLDLEGGIRALARDIAEDAAATKVVRGMGCKVHLVDRPFEQPLGRRRLAAVWSRQLRWARLRRVTFPLYFVPEIFISAPVQALALAAALLATGHDAPAAILAASVVLALTYCAETALCAAKGWHVSRTLPAAMLARDALLPLVWTSAWFTARVTWHGQTIKVRTRIADRESPAAA